MLKKDSTLLHMIKYKKYELIEDVINSHVCIMVNLFRQAQRSKEAFGMNNQNQVRSKCEEAKAIEDGVHDMDMDELLEEDSDID